MKLTIRNIWDLLYEIIRSFVVELKYIIEENEIEFDQKYDFQWP